MKTTKKIIGFILIILIVVGGIGTGIYFLKDKKNDSPTIVKKSTNEIEGYGYTLDNLDTELYKTEYNILKDNLSSDNVNLEEYAKSISKMFIIDLYTIKNKLNKYDVGGLEFIMESNQQNFIDNVTDTIYKYVEDNSGGKREQYLPEVEKIDVISSEKMKFEIKENGSNPKKSYDAYKIKLKWSYIKDMGYDTEGEVIVINDNGILYVVEKN